MVMGIGIGMRKEEGVRGFEKRKGKRKRKTMIPTRNSTSS